MKARSFAIHSASTSATAGKRVLLREYIRRSLYDPIHGYFSKAEPPLLQHSTRPLFRQIPNRSAYQNTVAATHSKAGHGWMTPVQLFSPYLSRAIANRVQSVALRDAKVQVIEIGAGRGTLALDVLEYWSHVAPEFLRNISYNILEISPCLAQLQSRLLKRWIDSGHVKIFNSDAIRWFASLSSNPELGKRFQSSDCHVIGTEVLDNLPHDLIRVSEKGLKQAVVVLEDAFRDNVRVQELKWTSEIDETTYATINAFDVLNTVDSEMDDDSGRISFLERMRDLFETLLGAGERDIWVPTASYMLLQGLASSMPHAHVTISDFDSFPGALPGTNGPVVQSIENGSAIVFDSVQGAPFGKVDIMFPTSFDALRHGHKVLSEDRSRPGSHVYQILSQQQFFDEYALEHDKDESTCLDGYNPILQDFENASFFLADSRL